MNIAGEPFPTPLSYTGPKNNLIPIKMFKRRPTTADVKYRVGTFVILGDSPSTGSKGELWYLTEYNSSGEAVWHRIDTAQNDDNHIPWSVITAATHDIEVNNGYFANNAGVIDFTLPETAAVGDTISITNINGGFRIIQQTGQKIYVGTSSTTITSGTLDSTALGDAITLTCAVANTDFWATTPPQGNFTLS